MAHVSTTEAQDGFFWVPKGIGHFSFVDVFVIWLLNLEPRGVSDIGFSLFTVPNYLILVSEYFRCFPGTLRISRSVGSGLGVWK